MKKATTIIVILILIVVVGVVGVFAYFSGKQRQEADEATMTAVQQVLSRDLKNDYPATVKEVVKYYTEIQKCFYNQECTDEEIEQLGRQARQLFDAELQAVNEEAEYILKLKAEVVNFKSKSWTMTSAAVAASTNVDYFQEDGFEFARIHCGYNIIENNVNNSVRMVYLLRRDADKKWRIYGWDQAVNVNPQ